MTMRSGASLARSALPSLLLLYGSASLLHFSHNAEYLADYPNLPGWLSRSQVYLAWCGVTLIGVVGYALFARGRVALGLAVLAVYAGLGIDGLLHYTRAPMAAHSAAMNTTIWTEVAAAALLMLTLVALTAEWLAPRRLR